MTEVNPEAAPSADLSTALTSAHTYAQSGNYDVTVSVTGPYGPSASGATLATVSATSNNTSGSMPGANGTGQGNLAPLTQAASPVCFYTNSSGVWSPNFTISPTITATITTSTVDASGKPVCFAGNSNGTYEWTVNAGWQKIDTLPPTAMSATQDKNGNPILFWTYQNGNTWMWDNGVWSTNPLSNYQANVLSATQFANGTPTVFGSFAGLAGTWEFNGSVWTTVSSYQAVALSATRAFSGGPVCLGRFQ